MPRCARGPLQQLLGDCVHHHVGRGPNGGARRPSIDERHFSDDFAGSDARNLPLGLALHDRELPFEDDVERLDRDAFLNEQRSSGKALSAARLRQPVDVRVSQLPEDEEHLAHEKDAPG